METIAASMPRPVTLWRDCIRPKEHGSWSLAFEPLVLGLLVAPSAPGLLLAGALSAGFFARRPLRLATLERSEAKRSAALRALALCGVLGGVAFVAALALAGTSWLGWLLPVLAAGGVFAYFDARGAGREESAELAGAAAFALTPCAIGVLGGLSAPQAVALGVIMTARAVPSVACVRAFIRAAKTGVRHDALALATSAAALLATAWFVARGVAPWFALAAMAVFAARTAALLVVARPAWRAKTIGMIEAVLGLCFVAGLAASWNA